MDNFDLGKYLTEGRLFESQPYDDKTRKNEAEGLATDIELEGGKKQRFISDIMKATKGESWDTFYDIADEIMGKYLAEGRFLKESNLKNIYESDDFSEALNDAINNEYGTDSRIDIIDYKSANHSEIIKFTDLKVKSPINGVSTQEDLGDVTLIKKSGSWEIAY